MVGISTDSVESHRSFGGKYGFPFTLLSDGDGEVISEYDVKSWIPGKSARAVVIIGKDGLVKSREVQPLSIFRPKDADIIAAIEAAKNE